MRIFYAAAPTPNSALLDSRLWHANLYLALRDLGHELVPFRYDLTRHLRNVDPSDPRQAAFIATHRPKLEAALLDQVRRAHRQRPLDIFFSYFANACARPEVIREIGGYGICTVNWYCNASYQFHLVQDIAAAYHYCLVPEKFRIPDYRRVGANPLYCQMAANPQIYRPYDLPREFEVTFVGQKYGDRPRYIRTLLDHGIAVRVWGWGWRPTPRDTWASRLRRMRDLATTLGSADGRRAAVTWLRDLRGTRPTPGPQPVNLLPPEVTGPPLSDEELVRMHSRSKISLGFSGCDVPAATGERILQVRLRDFEAPMSGAFYMVECIPELEAFYEIGREIVCYADPDDLADKAKYYLAHEAEREAIRQAGHRRARAEHTWQARFAAVFRQIGL
jgi:hypothetical protein